MADPEAPKDGGNTAKDTGIKAWRWLLFSAIGGCIPFLLIFFLGLGSGNYATLTDMFGRGDLYMVGCALSFGGIGEFVGKSFGKTTFRQGVGILLGFLAGINSILCGYLFAAANDDILQHAGKSTHPVHNSWVSIDLTIVGFVIASLCVVMTEEMKEAG